MRARSWNAPALVADCAAGGQVLVSRAVVMESSQSTAAASNHFGLLTTKTLGEWECELHQYNVPGMAERTFVVADDNDDNVDSVAMALQQSAGAVQKKVTVLEVAFSPMGQVSVQEHAKLMSQLHADLAAAVLHEKGVVSHADGFHFTITFNCAAAASLQAQRAVRTAVELAGWAQYGRAMCGIASCRQTVVRTSGSSGEDVPHHWQRGFPGDAAAAAVRVLQGRLDTDDGCTGAGPGHVGSGAVR